MASPPDEVLWTTTIACANVTGSSRVRPLTPDSAPKLATPRLKENNHPNYYSASTIFWIQYIFSKIHIFRLFFCFFNIEYMYFCFCDKFHFTAHAAPRYTYVHARLLATIRWSATAPAEPPTFQHEAPTPVPSDPILARIRHPTAYCRMVFKRVNRR
jgi:hypothetical protein